MIFLTEHKVLESAICFCPQMNRWVIPIQFPTVATEWVLRGFSPEDGKRSSFRNVVF